MIKNRQVPETIPEIQDFYYDKSVIKILFNSKLYAQCELRKVHSKRPPSNVGPQAGCVLVLDGSSISRSWLYEASGYKVTTASTWQGGVSASIYCLEENQAEAEVELLKAVKEAAEKASMGAEYILRSYQSAIDSVTELLGQNYE